MEENKVEKNEVPETATAKDGDKKIKTRQGSGYLRQLYSTARNTAGNNPSNFKNLTTFLVNFVPVDKIDVSEYQVRTHFEDSEIVALSHSIKEHGVLQPILVVQNGDRYKVIAGERRLRASKLAGLERIPARVITSDDKAVHEIALRENLDRVDLHPIEEGEGYLSLLEAQAYTSHEGISIAFGKPKSRITECIGFTRLPETTKEELLRRNIGSRSVLRKLLSSPPEAHLEMISQIAKAGDDALTLNVEAPKTSSAPVEKKTFPKREIEAFEYEFSEKKLQVPAFRWKVGEGKERLKDYADKLEKLLEQVWKVLK